MVEERTLKVLLCCWIDSWPKIIWREHRELESKLLGKKRWFHGDACQHEGLFVKIFIFLMQVDFCPAYDVVVVTSHIYVARFLSH